VTKNDAALFHKAQKMKKQIMIDLSYSNA